MNFGQALEALKTGRRVARDGWNGKGMFVFLVPGSNFKVNRPPLLGIYPEGTEINYRPHIDLKGADGSVSTWAPSGSDALAEDWLCIDGDFGDTNTLESLQQEARLKLVHELMEILGADDPEAIIEHVKRMVEKPLHNNVVGGGGTRAIQLDLLGAIAGALSRFGEAPETLERVRDLIAKPGVELSDVAREASIAAGRNASVAPQLLYADILFTLEGAFGKLNLNAKGR